MAPPTLEEIRKSFPGRVPDEVTSIVIIEAKPKPDSLYKENSMIEWIGYFKGCAVGVKRFLFGSAGWAQIVLTSIGLFVAFTSDQAKGTWQDFESYASAKIVYVEDLASRYMTFGDLPKPLQESTDKDSSDPIPFEKYLATVPVSGHYIGGLG